MATTVGTLLVNVIGDASGLASSLGNAERVIESFGSRLFFLGGRITAGVTLPIVGFLTAVGRLGMEFDKEMTESLAIMDDVTAEMRDLMEDRAIEISTTSKFAAKEVAEGYYDLASAGFKAEESLDMIGTVATFAQAGLMDMGEAGEFLAGAVRSVGLEMIGSSDNMEAMARVADVLTAANNRALGTVKDFSAALTKQFGAVMKTHNIALEDGMALLMGYAENNIRGARASTLAMMATRDVMSATIRAGDAWKKYGISVFDAEKNLRKMPDILDQILMRMQGFSASQITEYMKTGVRGKPGKPMPTQEVQAMFLDLGIQMRSVNALQQIIKSGPQIRKWAEELRQSSGEAAEVAAKQAESMSVRWIMALHRIEEAGIRLFNSYKPFLIDLFTKLGEWGTKLTELAKKYETLSPATKQWVLQMTAGVALLGPTIAILGSWILLLGGVAGAISGTVRVLATLLRMLFDYKGVMAVLGKTPESSSMAKVFVGFSEGAASLGGALVRLAPAITTFAAVFDLLLPAMKEIRSYFGDWSVNISVSKEAIDRWLTTGKYFLNILNDIRLIIQFGWVQIVKLAAAVIEEWKGAINSAWIVLKSTLMDGIPRFAKAMIDMVGEIPLIGDAFKLTFTVGKVMLFEFWSMMKTIFGLMAQAAIATGQIILRYLIPPELRVGLAWAAAIVTGSRSIHDGMKSASNAMDDFLVRIGVIQFKASHLKGTFEALKRAMPRTGQPTDPAAFEDLFDPSGEGFFPPGKPDADDRNREIERQERESIERRQKAWKDYIQFQNFLGERRFEKEEANARKLKEVSEELNDHLKERTLTRVDFEIYKLNQWYLKQKETLDTTATEYLKLAAALDALMKARLSWYQWIDQSSLKARFSAEAVLEPLREAVPEKTPASFGVEHTFIESWGTVLKNWIATIPGIFQQAFTGGGGIGGALVAVLSGAFSSILSRVGKAIAKDKGLGDIASGIVEGIFSAGGSLIVSGLMAWVDHMKSRAARQTMRSVGREYGMEISQGLAETIAKEAQSKYGGNRQISALMHFGEILSQGGGLSEHMFGKMRNRLRDFFVAVETGALSGSTAMSEYAKNFAAFADFINARGMDLANEFVGHLQVMSAQLRRGLLTARDVNLFIGQSFQSFADNMENSMNVAGRSWKTFLDLARQAGSQVKVMQEWLSGQLGAGGTQFGAMVQAITYKFTGLADEIKTVREEIDELNKVSAEGRGIEWTQQMSDAQKKLNGLLEKQRGSVEGNKEALETMASTILALFNAGLDNGLSWFQVMTQMGPALEALVKGFADMGITSDNAAVRQLTWMHTLFTANKELFAGIDALTQGLITLSRLGALNQETFDAMGKSAQDLFIRVQAQTAAQGGTHKDALRAMLPFLAQMRNAAMEYGFVLDENTQRLIDQAIELGLLKPAGKSTADILKDGFDKVAGAVGKLTELLERALTVMGLLNDEAGQFPGFPNLPDPPPGTPGPGPTPQPFASRPRYAPTTADLIGVGGAGNVPLTVPVYIDGWKAAEALVPHIPGVTRRYGLDR